MKTNEKEHAMAIEKLRRFCIERGLPDPTRPVVVFNTEYIGEGKIPAVPSRILMLIDEHEDAVQKRIITPDEAKQLHFSSEEATRFKKGEPVLINPYILDPRGKQGSGGQPLDPLEDKVKNAAGDSIYVAVEQLRELLKIRDKRFFTKLEEARNNAKQSLANAYLRTYNPVIDAAKCETLINSLFKHGQRRGGTVSGVETRSSNQIIKSWTDNLEIFTKADVLEEIDFIETVVTSLIKCRVRSRILRIEENNLLKLVPSKSRDGISTERVIAGTQTTHHQHFEDLMPAAFTGDFNPSELFPHLGKSHVFFETIRLIGRVSKGHLDVSFSAKQLDVLESAISILKTWESYPKNHKGRITSKNSFLARAMSRVMSSTEWHERYMSKT